MNTASHASPIHSDLPVGDADRALCLTLSNFLHATARLAMLGLVFTGLALFSAVHGSAPLVVAALVLGLTERLLALRLAFDARLFAALAHGGLPTLRGLDRALAALGLRAASARTRGLAERIWGTRLLVMQHVAVVALQAVLAAVLLLRT